MKMPPIGSPESDHDRDDHKQLGTNRFAWGPVLNAFQMATVDNVQIKGLHGYQTYVVVPPFVPKKDSKGVQVDPKDKPKPGTSTEIVVLTIEGHDTGSQADTKTSYSKFKDTLANVPYFKENLSQETGLRFKVISEPVVLQGGKTAVQFTLEVFYPEKVRSNE